MAVVWHNEIANDFNKIIDFLDYYEKELADARSEVKMSGLLVNVLDRLPALYEVRYSQLQDVEAVIEMFENKIKRKRSEKYKLYLENYNRALSSTDVNRYVDGDFEVVELYDLKNEASLIRNKLLGVIKAFEMKHYSMGNITKLRAAGIEDASL